MSRFQSFILTLALCAAAFATRTEAVGVDLSWNACWAATNATSATTFSCGGSTDEEYPLVLAFKSPVAMPNFVAMTAYVDLAQSFGGFEPLPALQPFWHYENSGCNRTGISVSHAIPDSCANRCYGDLFQGGTAGSSIALYQPDYPQPGRGRFVLLAARPDAVPLLGNVDYFAMEVRFNNRNRATCAGCSEPKVIVFSELRLEGNDGQIVSLTAANKQSDCALINGASGSNCSGYRPGLRLEDIDPPCGVTPAVRETWGRLKSLYR